MIKTGVIFCGGYGKRLGSITKKIPKPMVLVNKKPFLEHLIIQLKNLGIKKIYLLIGYKHNFIKKYFKNGKKLGVKIIYSFNEPDKETGYRLHSIKKKIKEDFLLMYGDNYSPINLIKHFLFFKKNKSLITLSVSKKKNGNVKFLPGNKIKYYSKRDSKLSFVEIGYMICSKKIFNFVNNKNVSFSNYFNNKNICNRLNGLEIKNKYLSISDKQRLSETRKYFLKKNIILIDRDGVLNLKNEKSRYVRNLGELKMNEKIISILKKFPNMKYICITNQAGIRTKEVKMNELNKIKNYIKNYLRRKKINIVEFFISTAHFKSNNFYRKPNPGNFLKAAEKYKLILDKTFYIGDDPRDVLASYNSNTQCVYLGKKNELKKIIKSDIKSIIINNLSNALSLKQKSEY